jgi:GT2 family glycosyltransferase
MAADGCISILIPTSGRPQGFEQTLVALAGLAGSDHRADLELVVVFDGCEPYCGPSLRSLPFAVKTVVHPTARGIAGARNRAAELASGDVLVLLDDDAIPTTTWLSSLQRGLGAYPDRLCFGGRVVCSHEPANVIARLRDEVYYRETFGEWYAAPDGYGGADLPGPPYVNGGNSAFRREVFATLGLFREDLPAYVDVEFGLRARCRETGILLDGFTIRHAHPTTLRAYLHRSHTSGRARARLRAHAPHSPRRVSAAIVRNLAWNNILRARRLPRAQPVAFAVLTLQEIAHGFGYLRG